MTPFSFPAPRYVQLDLALLMRRASTGGVHRAPTPAHEVSRQAVIKSWSPRVTQRVLAHGLSQMRGPVGDGQIDMSGPDRVYAENLSTYVREHTDFSPEDVAALIRMYR